MALLDRPPLLVSSNGLAHRSGVVGSRKAETDTSSDLRTIDIEPPKRRCPSREVTGLGYRVRIVHFVFRLHRVFVTVSRFNYDLAEKESRSRNSFPLTFIGPSVRSRQGDAGECTRCFVAAATNPTGVDTASSASRVGVREPPKLSRDTLHHHHHKHPHIFAFSTLSACELDGTK